MSTTVTVADVLSLPVLASGKPLLVGGSDGLATTVRWVHVSEVAHVSDLLRGGELLLTTGIGLDAPEDFLRKVHRAGAAGLIIELGERLHTIPPRVGRVADQLGFPVIALRRETRFVEVTEVVHRLIVNAQYHELAFTQTVHETFTALNLQRATVTEIVTQAARLLDAPVVLEDLAHRLVASHGVVPQDWERRSRIGDRTWAVVPVGISPRWWARLVVPDPHEQPDRARLVLERAAQSLELQQRVERDREDLVQLARSGLLDDLVGGRIPSESAAQSRARSLGLLPHNRFRPVVLAHLSDTTTDLTAHRTARRMLAAITTAAREAKVAVIASSEPESVRMITSADAAEPLAAALESTLPAAVRWVLGAGPVTGSLLDAAANLTIAEHVAGAALPLRTATYGSTQRVFTTADVRFRGLITLLRSDRRLLAFAESELGQLLSHDARHGTDLTDLLAAHLAAGGSKSELARVSELSRPTLYARLAQIERILGVSVTDPESRTSLHAAMMMYQQLRPN